MPLKDYASHHVESSVTPNQVTSPRRKMALSSACIAVIDDDDDIRDALEQLLRGVGYEVVGYERADRALLELEKGRAPDLIVLDLMLPGMNGWNFRVEQKKCSSLRDVPVVALSADVSPHAKAVDADAYVPKPVDFSELQAVIGRVLLANERRRLMVKSMELERIRELGLLVASVAHEINNPLTYVVGSLELASELARELERMDGPDVRGAAAELAQNLADAADGSSRIAAVVKLLSTFSRADAPDASEVDVVRAVQAASRLARHQILQGAQFEEELEPVPHVIGNEGRLAQVVLNLLVNAAQATSASAGEDGLVRVTTRVAHGSVVIEVSDTGPGIEPEVLERIFEPFFTTKPAGTGTGLGLSISRDIVSAMGGTLTVRSVAGQGASFIVKLPAAGEGTRIAEPGAAAELNHDVTTSDLRHATSALDCPVAP